MKYEPPIDRSQLVETICTVYGLPVDALQFVPVRFAAVCYVAVCEDGTRRFVKLWPTTQVNRDRLAQSANRSFTCCARCTSVTW